MAEERRLGALLDSASEGAAHSTDDAAVLTARTRAHSSKLKIERAAHQEYGQEVGQALEPTTEPGSA